MYSFKGFLYGKLLFKFKNCRKVYRYFAYDCASSFPGIPEGPPKKHTDVICTRAYSDVAPSTGGEVGQDLTFVKENQNLSSSTK